MALSAKESLQRDLKEFINMHSLENYWNMPDYLMAEILTNIIINNEAPMKDNLSWHGVKDVTGRESPKFNGVF